MPLGLQHVHNLQQLQRLLRLGQRLLVLPVHVQPGLERELLRGLPQKRIGLHHVHMQLLAIEAIAIGR